MRTVTVTPVSNMVISVQCIIWSALHRSSVKHNTQSPVVVYRVLVVLDFFLPLRHNGRIGVSNHQSRDCLHNRLFRRRSKKTSKLRVTGLCAGNSPRGKRFHLMTSSCNNDKRMTITRNCIVTTTSPINLYILTQTHQSLDNVVAI